MYPRHRKCTGRNHPHRAGPSKYPTSLTNRHRDKGSMFRRGNSNRPYRERLWNLLQYRNSGREQISRSYPVESASRSPHQKYRSRPNSFRSLLAKLSVCPPSMNRRSAFRFRKSRDGRIHKIPRELRCPFRCGRLSTSYRQQHRSVAV